jgi:hypothetical protein
MQSQATTVQAYLAEQTPERRAALETILQLMRECLDPRIVEGMNYGMIGYWVPFEVYPPGYHCTPDKPLPYAGLASQKQHLSLYLMGMYMDPEAAKAFERDWQAAGKKLDMGKSCIRFKRIEDLALDVLRKHLKGMQLDQFIADYTERYGLSAQKTAKARAGNPGKKPAQSATAAKAATAAKVAVASKTSATSRKKTTTKKDASPGKTASTKAPETGKTRATAKGASSAKSSAVTKLQPLAKSKKTASKRVRQ